MGPLLSSATPIGSVQVPPSGQPILLMADRQTTGGYARIATVISADLSVAGQLAPGDWIRFKVCERREAVAALIALEQTLMWAYPAEFFEKLVWHVPRNRPDKDALSEAAEWIRQARRPLIIAGGGVLYSEATEVLGRFVEQTGIPVGETMAGKGSVRFDAALNLGAIGVTGTLAANRIAREADLVIGIGTRYSDFTTASKTAFQSPQLRFININVAEFDSYKHGALPLTGDARVTIENLSHLLQGHRVATAHRQEAERLHA